MLIADITPKINFLGYLRPTLHNYWRLQTMSFKIRRRRFGHIAIASATTTLVANLRGKTLAQQNNSNNIHGVKVKFATPTLAGVAGKDTVQFSDEENSTPAIVVTSSDVATSIISSTYEIPAAKVENPNKLSERKNKAFSSQPHERLSGCTTLSDGTLIVSSVVGSNKGDITRLIFIDSKSNTQSKLKKSLKLTKFKKPNGTVESLLATKGGNLLAVISLNAGVPPFELASIDYQKEGEIISDNNPFGDIENSFLPKIPLSARLSNLAQSSNGTIYATMVSPESSVMLVQLDLLNKSQITGRGKIINLVELSFNDKPLGQDVLCFAFSPSDELFALANLDNQETNSLFGVDIKTGKMRFIRKFDVEKIAFVV